MSPPTARVAAIERLLAVAVGRRSIGPLEELFCQVLRFAPNGIRVARADWPSAIASLLAEDPRVFAGGGDGISVIELHLAGSVLSPRHERLIAAHLPVPLDRTVFVVSNRDRSGFHLLSIDPLPAQAPPSGGQVMRRMALGAGEPLPFVAARLAGLSNLPAAQALGRAFDETAVSADFLQRWELLQGRLASEIAASSGEKQQARLIALDYLDSCLAGALHYRLGWQRGLSEISLGAWLWATLAGGESILWGEHGTPPLPQYVAEAFLDEVCDVLGQFPLSIDEDGPLDRALAITPATLGAIYESLGQHPAGEDEAGGRAALGVYYTPPTEVDLMCRLALVSYLATALGEEHRGALCEAVCALDPSDEERAARVVGALPGEDRARLAHSLSALTVLDPAVGTGAFLVGMLAVLAPLERRVALACGLPAVSRAACIAGITGRMFGIDVQRGALRRASQRLSLAWLAACEEDPAIPGHPPAPHLLCGDALAGSLPFPAPGRLVSLAQGLRERGWMPLFGKARAMPSSSGEAVGQEGFGIVIGNPPYRRQERIGPPLPPTGGQAGPEERRAYKRAIAAHLQDAFPAFFAGPHARRRIDGKSDLSLYFFFRGLALLHAGGVLCFIAPSAWLDARYGAVLQEFLLRHCSIELVLENHARRSFVAAAVNTAIVLVTAPVPDKTAEEWARLVRFVALRLPFEQALGAHLFREIWLAQEHRSTERYLVHPIAHLDLLRDGLVEDGPDTDEGDEGG